MRISAGGLLLAGCLGLASGLPAAARAGDTPVFYSMAAVRPVITAIQRGDCDRAVKVANDGVASDDGGMAFLVGRMVNEGICTPRRPEAAAPFFELALTLGVTDSTIDWATKIGLGNGVQQSYERAGEVCRTGGVDPQARMSRYALGYACTLGGVSAEQLRTTLPRGALEPGAAWVAFTPSTGALEIRKVPRTLIAEADTGTRVHRPPVDVTREIHRAWTQAMARVPRPDATILDPLTVEVPIDLDATLEAAAARVRVKGDVLQLGQSYPGGMHMPAGTSRGGSH